MVRPVLIVCLFLAFSMKSALSGCKMCRVCQFLCCELLLKYCTCRVCSHVYRDNLWSSHATNLEVTLLTLAGRSAHWSSKLLLPTSCWTRKAHYETTALVVMCLSTAALSSSSISDIPGMLTSKAARRGKVSSMTFSKTLLQTLPMLLLRKEKRQSLLLQALLRKIPWSHFCQCWAFQLKSRLVNFLTSVNFLT